MWPWLLRPPVNLWPSVKVLTGPPFHNSLRSMRTTWRSPGVVGLNVLSAMSLIRLRRSDARGDVDRLAFGQGHDSFFVVRALPEKTLEALSLAPNLDRVDAGHLDVEQAFDGGLDQRLRRIGTHAKGHLVMLGAACRLF